jgi:PKHD-type hydroxylase
MKAEKVVRINKKVDKNSFSGSGSASTPNFDLTTTSWPFELDPVHAYAYWDNAFTKEECESIIKLGNFQKLRGSVVNVATDSSVYKENLDVRDSEVSWLYPCEDNQWVFRRLTDILVELNSRYFKFDIFGATEGFQFTKYVAPTGHYGKHIDCGFNSPVRKLSFTLQLSDPDDYKGGDLCLYTDDKPTIANRKQGFVTVFPSYVLHEVTPVTKGTRYSLVSWITGKPFK